MSKIIGQTKNTGFQIGARRTLPIHLEDAWQLIVSPKGISIWLGENPGLIFEKGITYQLIDGTTGEIRVFEPNSHLRITWHPKKWNRSSTIQIRVIPKNGKTTFAFHQEHLPGIEERKKRHRFFVDVLDRLEQIIIHKNV